MRVKTVKKVLGNIPILESFPVEMENDALPLIVYYHGWQINKELVMPQGKKYAAEGFRVVMPDAAHHGDRRQIMSDVPSLTFFQSIQTNLFEFEYVVDAYQKTGLATDQIGVGGLSMGGMTTFALLTHHPEIKAAAILMGTPDLIGYKNIIKQNVKRHNTFLPADYEALINWLPLYDLKTQPEKVGDTPLYIWHGDKDDRVPFEATKAFIDDNPQLNMQVNLEYGAAHLVTPKITNEVRDFFVRELL